MRAYRMPIVVALFGLSALIAAPGVCAGAESSAASVTVTARFSTRMSLKVSTELLRFDVTGPGQAPEAIVEFSAAARTAQGGEVLLTVEPAAPLNGPGGASDVETALTFSGLGDGLGTGELLRSAPTVAGRWVGSGLRKGRLVFTLRASVAGVYSQSVRFVVSAP